MRPFNDSKFWVYFDRAANLLNIPEKYTKEVASVQYGYGTELKPNFKNIRFGGFWTPVHSGSLYYNGVVFVRVALPFFIGFSVRWAAHKRRSYMQTHIGWKLNGEFAIALRFQSDKSAAEGYTSPNTGQAIGFSDGTK